jgi:uncharacterized LabA/DUF88 family protein
MVDTLIVADLAHKALTERSSNVVVVSSDIDMWPGIMIALRAGTVVYHCQAKKGVSTQSHLLQSLTPQMTAYYHELRI